MRLSSWLLPGLCLCVTLLLAESAFSCCSLAPASFSASKGLASEAIKDGKLVHLLAYQNIAANKNNRSGGNAMFLPIPAKAGSMSEKNILNTSKAPNILIDMELSLENLLKGEQPSKEGTGGADFPVKIFNSDIYTIVLATDPTQIPKALNLVPANKRPQLNKAIFDAYAKWYPGWTFALCCFDNKKSIFAKPMLWWYEPIDTKTLFFPGLDEHDGAVPVLKSEVKVDHVLMFSVPQLKDETGHKVDYSDRLNEPLKSLLPKNVLGRSYYGKMAQGDFQVNVADLRKGICKIERVLPPGLNAKSLGLAENVYKSEPAPERRIPTSWQKAEPEWLLPTPSAAKSIGPYRRNMLIQIAAYLKISHLDPPGSTLPVIEITIAKNGRVLSSKVLEPGTKASEAEFLKAIQLCKFEELPKWYKGDRITLKLDMAKAAALKP